MPDRIQDGPPRYNRPGGIQPEGGGFNISTFKSYREKLGVTRTHSYTVSFDFSPPIMPGTSSIFKNMEIICDSTNMPALTMDTYGVQYYGYGVVVKRPTIPEFTPLQATFVDDQWNNFSTIFSIWQRNIVNYFGDAAETHDQDAYELNYLEEYAVNMRLRMYNDSGLLVREVVFREAYPMIVGDIQYSWGRLNEIVKVPVVFAYTDWKDIKLEFQESTTKEYQPLK